MNTTISYTQFKTMNRFALVLNELKENAYDRLLHSLLPGDPTIYKSRHTYEQALEDYDAQIIEQFEEDYVEAYEEHCLQLTEVFYDIESGHIGLTDTDFPIDYSCPVCPQMCDTIEDYAEHLTNCHTHCFYCCGATPMVFATAYDRAVHMREHHAAYYEPCEYCTEELYTWENMDYYEDDGVPRHCVDLPDHPEYIAHILKHTQQT